jgi:hypothetical protein
MIAFSRHYTRPEGKTTGHKRSGDAFNFADLTIRRCPEHNHRLKIIKKINKPVN